MKKKRSGDYSGYMRNTGAQEVPAMRKTGGTTKAKAVRGSDLRNGK